MRSFMFLASRFCTPHDFYDIVFFFFFQAEDGIRDFHVTGVQTCALPILAWVIAFGRSCFWTTFFVYGPLFMVITGQGELAGGLLVSAGNGLLFMAIFWGRAGKRYGARNTSSFAFFAMAATLFAAGAVGELIASLTGAFLLGGALFAIAIDALGSTVFMRAVRSYERPQMAAVYRSYLDFSELTPPLVYSVVLVFFGLGS